jgi:serine protease Do
MSNLQHNGTEKMTKKSTRLRGRIRRYIGVFVVILLSCAAGFLGGLLGSKNTKVVTNTEVSQKIISNESDLISDLSKTVGQSVVSINVTVQGSFGLQSEQGAGTGIIISDDGVVVTNRHVIPTGTSSVSITLADGTELEDIDILGRTASSDPLDVAFLRIKDAKGKQLVPAKIGDSTKVQVGDKVIAIGNALGYFQNTVTSGIISGYGRDIEAADSDGSNAETLQNLFQTDAAINPGNSGGPLVNVNGEVIGLNVAVAGDAQSIGFAIPINDIKGLIASVEKNGRLVRPYLGVRYVTITDDVAYQYNLNTNRGAYIPEGNSIVSGGPADKFGIKAGDIITKINDVVLDDKTSLVSVLGKFSVGDKVEVTVVRDDKQITINVILDAAPEI